MMWICVRIMVCALTWGSVDEVSEKVGEWKYTAYKCESISLMINWSCVFGRELIIGLSVGTKPACRGRLCKQKGRVC
ncbi:hypothetical protein KP509_09G089600 [Ceratopteris richardii]|uniref:Secreted protein n=1 Tax=Ceratopteris richardii TaxID=49495 RepID=A0A8T2UCN9_CERRI|nr:hypothetical protein KP509_09G089600 [Ceratopteris richardii]